MNNTVILSGVERSETKSKDPAELRASSQVVSRDPSIPLRSGRDDARRTRKTLEK
jgi:hypothetical protein